VLPTRGLESTLTVLAIVTSSAVFACVARITWIVADVDVSAVTVILIPVFPALVQKTSLSRYLTLSTPPTVRPTSNESYPGTPW